MELSKLKAVCLWVIDNFRITPLVMLVFYGCGSEKNQLPFYNSADFTAEWISTSDPAYTKIHTIGDFKLSSQSGHMINKDSLNGHIYIANFFFSTCPTICPAMMHNLAQVAKAFTKQPKVKLVSFSVMPWRDDVHQLQLYASAHGIDEKQWYLLTGDTNQIYKLGRRSYFSEKTAGLTKANSDFLHTESMLLIDKKSRIRGVYAATDTAQVKRAIADIEVLLKEE